MILYGCQQLSEYDIQAVDVLPPHYLANGSAVEQLEQAVPYQVNSKFSIWIM